jgi:hypothetical protein
MCVCNLMAAQVSAPIEVEAVERGIKFLMVMQKVLWYVPIHVYNCVHKRMHVYMYIFICLLMKWKRSRVVCV